MKFSQEKADIVLDRIAGGQSLRTACQPDDVPSRETIRQWLKDPENAEFVAQYVRAREDQADFYADQIISIADTEEDPQKARVRIDARKWVASKLKSKSYGDKVVNEHTGAEGGPVKVEVTFVHADQGPDPESL